MSKFIQSSFVVGLVVLSTALTGCPEPAASTTGAPSGTVSGETIIEDVVEDMQDYDDYSKSLLLASPALKAEAARVVGARLPKPKAGAPPSLKLRSRA